jgi:hypothetical protein
MASKATPNVARRAFVKASGIFGKYTYRALSYVGENAVAFLGLTATIAGLFLVSSAFGITIPVIVAAAESAVATLAGLPLLAGTVALAAAIAAPETLKKIYKECTTWIVKAYQKTIKDWFMPKDFTVSVEKAQDEKVLEKHPKIVIQENEFEERLETDEEHAARLTAQRAAKYAKIADAKTGALDLAGKSGQKSFKLGANYIADKVEDAAAAMGKGATWVSGAPGYLSSFLPESFLCCWTNTKNSKTGNGQPLMKAEDELEFTPGGRPNPRYNNPNPRAL